MKKEQQRLDADPLVAVTIGGATEYLKASEIGKVTATAALVTTVVDHQGNAFAIQEALETVLAKFGGRGQLPFVLLDENAVAVDVYFRRSFCVHLATPGAGQTTITDVAGNTHTIDEDAVTVAQKLSAASNHPR